MLKIFSEAPLINKDSPVIKNQKLECNKPFPMGYKDSYYNFKVSSSSKVFIFI